MKNHAFVLVTLSIIILMSTSGYSTPTNTQTLISGETTSLSLLRSEHYLYLTVLTSTEETTIDVAFPAEYGFQQPMLLEIHDDTTPHLATYAIIDDIHHPPNKLVRFTLVNLAKHTRILLHFSFWVLTQHHDYSDMPKEVAFPTPNQLPDDTLIWLQETDVVQTNHILIQRKARQLQGFSDNMISYIQRVAPFIKYHRYFLFLIQLNQGIFFNQDAVTTLLINGENVGRSHLAAALLRTKNIPARVLLAHNDQGFWTQMHYMLEYYVPDYGWVLLDSTKGQTPYETQRQIINRICYPSDENDTKKDYIIPFMRGEERWMWYDSTSIQPYYVDCDSGSKSKMFIEHTFKLNSSETTSLLQITQQWFSTYEHYFDSHTSETSTESLITATEYILQGFEHIKQADLQEYEWVVLCALTEISNTQ